MNKRGSMTFRLAWI